MVSSRRSRKHHKLGTEGFVQSRHSGDAFEPEPIPSAEERRTFPARRLKLAEEFARLPKDNRETRVPEFRRRLKQVCASDLEFNGYWQIKFEPLLPQAKNKNRSARKRKPRSKRTEKRQS